MSCVGLEVGCDRVHAVLTRGSRMLWHGATPVALQESVADAVERLLSDMPLSGRARRSTRVHVAAGPSWVQTKALTGLPDVANPRLLPRLIRENAPSFFLRARGPLVLGAIDSRADGTTWAAAFDESVLLQVIDGVQRSGMRFELAVPAISTVASLLSDGPFTWTDGNARAHVTARNGVIARVRVSGEPNPMPAIPPALTPAGAHAWLYAAAYAAARSSRNAAFVWRPQPDPRRLGRRRAVTHALAASTVIIATVAMLLAPGIRAARFVARHSGELEHDRAMQAEIARAEGELRRVSALLDGAARFRSRRGDMTFLLAELTRALPESTAMISLRVDSLEGSFVALAAHTAGVVPQLTTLAHIAAPRLVGSVTAAQANDVRMERATFRFRRVRTTPEPAKERARSPRSPSVDQ